MSSLARRYAATSFAILLLLLAPPLQAQDAAESDSDSATDSDATDFDAPEAESADMEDSGTTASASVEGAPSSERRPTPRVAVVLIGDPDPSRRAAAAALDAQLGELGLQRLGDVAMRAALLGEVRQDDGLERLHAARRRLLFDEDPASTLRDLGERLQVNALVVIRPTDPARVAVFDITARSFYEEEPLLSTLDATARFVRRAAHAAARRAAAPPPANVARATEESTDTSRTRPEAETGRPARRWLRAHWAYVVGGALLVGVITGFVVRGRRDRADPPPILRFRPGVE